MFGKKKEQVFEVVWEWRVRTIVGGGYDVECRAANVRAFLAIAKWFSVASFDHKEDALEYAQKHDGENPRDVGVIWKSGMNHYVGQF